MVTVAPRMYREALALAIHRERPHVEVMLAPPEALDVEFWRFRPHLLVRNDNEGATPEMLERVGYSVEVLFSDGLDAKISLDGRLSTVKDMGIEDLLAVVDEVQKLVAREH